MLKEDLEKLQKNENLKVKTLIMRYIKIGILYLTGFALTWGIKWILVDVFFNKGIILNAIHQVIFRINGDKTIKDTVQYALFRNFDAFDFYTLKIIPLLFLMTIIPKIVILVKNKEFNKETLKENCKYAIIYFINAILPILWFSVLKNHSIHHPFFTNRNLVILIVSIEIAILSIIDMLPDNKKMKNKM